MHRRKFLISSALAPYLCRAGVGPSSTVESSAILSSYTPEDHRRRLLNIARCERGIRECLRKQIITDYIPGHACYNVGEYPCRKPWGPDEWDERELDRLKTQGIQLIQVMEEWNDLLRLFGGDKYTSTNPAGLRRFVEMVHKRGMKIILYTSSGFMQSTDPDFHSDWARPGYLQLVHWNMARCSPASAGWRAYMIPRVLRILDEYGVDGLYNDLGYRPLSGNPTRPTRDEVLAFPETADHDGALGDLLALLYSEVKRRGGIYKLHRDAALLPNTAKFYDYLWVGEGVPDLADLREKTKDFPSYVIPCIDRSVAMVKSEDEPYVNSIPYLQFPILLAGRPFTGERAVIPGVHYFDSYWTRRWREMWKYYQSHPQGPFSYGIWDAFPGNPEIQSAHAKWLDRYRHLVKDGTYAYLQITKSDFIVSDLPKSVVASVYTNLDVYLVLANYGSTAAQVDTTDSYVQIDRQPGLPQKHWKIPGQSLLILKQEMSFVSKPSPIVG
jgi:hypothetical protein